MVCVTEHTDIFPPTWYMWSTWNVRHECPGCPSSCGVDSKYFGRIHAFLPRWRKPWPASLHYFRQKKKKRDTLPSFSDFQPFFVSPKVKGLPFAPHTRIFIHEKDFLYFYPEKRDNLSPEKKKNGMYTFTYSGEIWSNSWWHMVNVTPFLSNARGRGTGLNGTADVTYTSFI